MRRLIAHGSRMMVLAALGLAAMQSAQAQQPAPPARIGNVYNGTSHEPDAGAVHSNEQRAGVALPQAAQNQQNQQVESQAKVVEQRASGAGPTGATPITPTAPIAPNATPTK